MDFGSRWYSTTPTSFIRNKEINDRIKGKRMWIVSMEIKCIFTEYPIEVINLQCVIGDLHFDRFSKGSPDRNLV